MSRLKHGRVKCSVWINEGIELRYISPSLGDGAFGLQVIQSEALEHLVIRYWLETLSPDLILDSFGLRFEQVENLLQYLRNGYFSWDRSYYVQPDTLPDEHGDISHLERGYGMCQLCRVPVVEV